MNKDELLKYYKYIGLNESDFWNQCLKEFGPEETKRMREESRKNIKKEYITTNPSSPFFKDAFNFLMEKQSDGLIGWTEEDEEEMVGEPWDDDGILIQELMSNSGRKNIRHNPPTYSMGLNFFEDPDDDDASSYPMNQID